MATTTFTTTESLEHALARPSLLIGPDGKRLNISPFQYTHGAADDGEGEVNLVRLPAGKISIYPAYSRIRTTVVFNPRSAIAITDVDGDPARVTQTAHGYSLGTVLKILAVGGAVEVNFGVAGLLTITEVVDANNYDLGAITGGVTTYTSGGTTDSFGANLHIGLRAYTKAAGGGAVAENLALFVSDLDAGAAVLNQVWSSAGPSNFDTESGLTVVGMIDKGFIDEANKIQGWVAWSFDA